MRVTMQIGFPTLADKRILHEKLYAMCGDGLDWRTDSGSVREEKSVVSISMPIENAGDVFSMLLGYINAKVITWIAPMPIIGEAVM